MALDKSRINEWSKRLLLSKMRLLASHSFYGLLLTHMQFNMDESVATACTDGIRIFFGPDFLDSLSDDELDLVMMHEILHIALQHCLRYNERDPELFNIACDIVVNSNIAHSHGDDLSKIMLHGEPIMHLAPNKMEGYHYTAEEVYEMLVPPNGGSGAGSKGNSNGGNAGSNGQSNGSSSKSKNTQKNSASSSGVSLGTGGNGARSKDGGSGQGVIDDHSRWARDGKASDELRDAWTKRVMDAAQIVAIEDPTNARGLLPLCAERLLKELTKSQLDWKQILHDFVQVEINDYSFSPPDRRFGDGDFYLPDFNDASCETVKNILFMIDTSGSMSDGMITQCYSEILSAIEQFDGKLQGKLGFFDAAIVEPIDFSSTEELKIIRPYGGGGTNFDIIFEYVAEEMDEKPISIIILTDGYAPFPDEEMAMDIPVLWVINNDSVTPPWGKIARIENEN